jgi:GxxExxY protein
MSQPYVKAEYALSDVTGRIIAAAQEVHRTLGPGFEEVVYQRALALELPTHSLEFSREVWIDVCYKGANIGKKRVDFVIGTSALALSVMLEIKAKAVIEDVHFVQALSYLKASGYPIGLLLNFGAPTLQIKRIANQRRSTR